MCDQKNLKDQFVTNLKLKGLMCDQNNLKDQSITKLKLKGAPVYLTFSVLSNFMLCLRINF